ncbi:ubiquitin-like protein Pup [Amycolatopsis sp. NPDC059090]|uniref:ubiquitin-like protein Pup n=1 Tax=Amycolatopsis sp. NPDC059090 TaxID=3346723 RepID=UPI00366B55D1
MFSPVNSGGAAMSQHKTRHERDDDEPEPTSEADTAVSRKEKNEGFDTLIDEIDAIIEETGVIEYIQKDGQ